MIPARRVVRARVSRLVRDTVEGPLQRYRAEGLGGLVDRPRSGPPSVLDRQTVERILLLTTERVPMEATHWNTRLMARYAGVTQWQVRQVSRPGRCSEGSPVAIVLPTLPVDQIRTRNPRCCRKGA